METYWLVTLAGILFIIFITNNIMSMFTLYIYIMYIDIYYIYTLIERDIKKPFQMRHDN